MTFEIIDKDETARIGRIRTRHGDVETPALFPVINPLKQSLTLEEVKSIGFRQIITNAYIIKRNYGDLAREAGIHRLLNWDGVIMTDSGAYQILQYGSVDVDPATILEYQVSIGSDIGVILDIPTSHPRYVGVVKAEVDETLRRAREAIEARDRVDPEHRMLLVGPIQGGVHLSLLAYSARSMGRLPFDIYAIGSPTTLLEEYNFLELAKMVITAKLNLPLGKPIHLFGVGHPLVMPLMAALGIDLFDSASYILYAYDDRVIFSDRTARLSELGDDYLIDWCLKTVKEVREMPKEDRVRCLAKHNLTVLAREIIEIKQRIRENDIWGYVAGKARLNPMLYAAYKWLMESRLLSKLIKAASGGLKVNATQLVILDEADEGRPEVRWARSRLRNVIEGIKADKAIVLIGNLEKPAIRDPAIDRLRGLKAQIYVYDPVFGLVPIELSDVYPFSQVIPLKDGFRRVRVNSRLVVVIAEEEFRKVAERAISAEHAYVILVDSLRNIDAYLSYLKELLDSNP